MEGWQDGFIAVDWGTTNRRAYLLDAAGSVVDEMEDEAGVTSVAKGGFPAAVAEITARLGDKPLLMAGMIGSNRGWQEAAYVRCPVTLADLSRQLLWVEPGRIAIVPGVAFTDGQRADVMRGEEVQLFGYLRSAPAAAGSGLLCHPGTHTKWIRIEDGALTSFRTFMTGELFALLRDHSILAPLLDGPVEADASFLAGADVALAGCDLASELFSVRARALLGQLSPADTPDWISGLLIGADVRGGTAGSGDAAVTVLGRPSLNRLYGAVLARYGRRCTETDGGPAFVAGMLAIKEALSAGANP